MVSLDFLKRGLKNSLTSDEYSKLASSINGIEDSNDFTEEQLKESTSLAAEYVNTLLEVIKSLMFKLEKYKNDNNLETSLDSEAIKSTMYDQGISMKSMNAPKIIDMRNDDSENTLGFLEVSSSEQIYRGRKLFTDSFGKSWSVYQVRSQESETFYVDIIQGELIQQTETASGSRWQSFIIPSEPFKYDFDTLRVSVGGTEENPEYEDIRIERSIENLAQTTLFEGFNSQNSKYILANVLPSGYIMIVFGSEKVGFFSPNASDSIYISYIKTEGYMDVEKNLIQEGFSLKSIDTEDYINSININTQISNIGDIGIYNGNSASSVEDNLNIGRGIRNYKKHLLTIKDIKNYLSNNLGYSDSIVINASRIRDEEPPSYFGSEYFEFYRASNDYPYMGLILNGIKSQYVSIPKKDFETSKDDGGQGEGTYIYFGQYYKNFVKGIVDSSNNVITGSNTSAKNLPEKIPYMPIIKTSLRFSPIFIKMKFYIRTEFSLSSNRINEIRYSLHNYLRNNYFQKFNIILKVDDIVKYLNSFYEVTSCSPAYPTSDVDLIKTQFLQPFWLSSSDGFYDTVSSDLNPQDNDKMKEVINSYLDIEQTTGWTSLTKKSQTLNEKEFLFKPVRNSDVPPYAMEEDPLNGIEYVYSLN